MTAILYPVRRGASLVLTAVSAASVVLLAGIAVALLLGYRPLVVRSDSMAPTIRTGDVIVTKVTSPRGVGPGDVVTFSDPTRGDRLVTHRVVERELAAGMLHFVTRGDANGAQERWSVPASGRIGEYRARIPGVGFTVGIFTTAWARAAALSIAAATAGVVALRRIWAL